MSILRPLIYDPLVEWSKPQTTAGKRKGKHQNETGEVTNEQAMNHVRTIEKRLTGQSIIIYLFIYPSCIHLCYSVKSNVMLLDLLYSLVQSIFSSICLWPSFWSCFLHGQ